MVPVVIQRPKPKYPKLSPGLDPRQTEDWRTRVGTEYKSYLKLGSDWARASELTTPAPRGHFLRDFGQSDRNVIENANDQASVPQVLNLLNGPLAPALTNRFSVLGRRLHAARDAGGKSPPDFSGPAHPGPDRSRDRPGTGRGRAVRRGSR